MADLTEITDVREAVRERYAAAARSEGSCCGPAVSTTDATGREVFGATLYAGDDAEGAPEAAVGASLGCGVPTAVLP